MIKVIETKVKSFFISQPMHGLSDEEILSKRNKVIKKIFDVYPNANIISTFFNEPENQNKDRLWYLGRSIQMMSNADYLVRIDGWKNARGCCIESEVADLYGIEIIDEKDL